MFKNHVRSFFSFCSHVILPKELECPLIFHTESWRVDPYAFKKAGTSVVSLADFKRFMC